MNNTTIGNAETMRAVRVEIFGPPEVLSLEEVPIPVPGPGEVLIRTAATSINASDITHRQGPGFLGPAPRVLGWDVAGSVEQLGVGVSVHNIGDKIFGMLPYPKGHGAAAEYVVAPARAMIQIPGNLKAEEAAALPLAGLTAWQALVETARIEPGKKVLIHGAAGGVGHLATQIAKAKGCFVAATVRSSQHDFVLQQGADEVIDFEEADFSETHHRFDAVLDTVGGDYPERSARVLAQGGHIVSLALRKTRRLDSTTLPDGGVHSLMLVEADSTGILEIAKLVQTGLISPTIVREYQLDDVIEAHRHFERGNVNGKIVVIC